ncbi:MAG: signal peptidase I [Lachnospiraceae bacterium]|nr:signal peptidase I [Lachnospiraceae bacterium]
MKQFLKCVLNIFILAFSVLLAAVLVNGLVQRFLSRDGYTGLFGIGTAVVVSGSMEPVLNIGDVVFYQSQEPEAYGVGDIVLYIRDRGTDEERLIIHRIQSFAGNLVITKGDANDVADKPFEPELIVGRLVLKIPRIGLFGQYIRTRTGRLITAGAVLVLLAAAFIVPGIRKKTETVNGPEYLEY